jgi:hypothetical protein
MIRRPVRVLKQANMSLVHRPTARIKIPSPMKIELTETEAKLCQILDECTVHLQKEKGISTTCRIAGGWVRDKVNLTTSL